MSQRTPASASSSVILTVSTFNICSGRGPDGRVDPARFTAAFQQLEADVVALQEVDLDQPRSHRMDQIAIAAEAFGARSWRMQPTLSGTPGAPGGWQSLPIPYHDGRTSERHRSQSPQYGIGLLSRLPVRLWRTCHLGASRAVLPFPVPRPGSRIPRIMVVPDEPRVALAAVIDTTAGPVTVISTHLSFAPLTARRQLHQLVRWAHTLPGPRILAGDLNLPGNWSARISGWCRLAQYPSYPADRARTQLDHVLTDHPCRDDINPQTSSRLPISDHLPVTGTIRLG
ncbi:MAG: endonuclease/exonuclease/phosphatase family protein [Actinomycetota bacterium]